MTTTIIWTIAIISGLGLLLALTLYLVAQRFKVVEDPLIELVEKAMPGANCGGCGFAGCHAFAESAVKAPNLDNHFCPDGGHETMKKVAEIVREKRTSGSIPTFLMAPQTDTGMVSRAHGPIAYQMV